MRGALPPGSAGVVAIYDRPNAATVDATLTSAVKKSVAHVDGHSAKKLKGTLAAAECGVKRLTADAQPQRTDWRDVR